MNPSDGEASGQRRQPVRKLGPVAPRAKHKVGISKTFGFSLGFEEDDNGQPKLDAKGKKIPKEREVTAFVEPHEFTPKIDPNYVFPAEETKAILLGIEVKDRLLLVGHTGTGKSSLLQQVAARLNYAVFRVNFDGAVSRQDLIGEWIIKGNVMEFQYGILPKAFQTPGAIIILDEWDAISGECAFVLQRPLEKDDGRLLLMETGGELIDLHEDNVIAATANTTGQGDETGLYAHGTKVQNYAQLNRFTMTIKLEYMAPDQEKVMLMKRVPQLSAEEATALTKAIHLVREAHANNEISAPLSPRDLINWGEKYVKMGDPMRAAKYCFLNRMAPEDAQTVEGLIQRVFEG